MKEPFPSNDYRTAKEMNAYIVDKTLLIKEMMSRHERVTLITRPRRFGRTYNMSMMAEFFDITKDSKDIFEGIKIMDTEYSKELNQWPVISLSFSDAKRNETAITSSIRYQLYREYMRHKSAVASMDSDWKYMYDAMLDLLCSMNTTLDQITSAIQILARVLCKAYQKKVIELMLAL